MKKSQLIFTALKACTVLIPFLTLAGASSAQEAQGWALHAGGFNTANDAIAEVGVEYRFKPFHIGSAPFVPAAGGAVTEDGNFWIYGGVRYDFELSKHLVVTPNFAVSLYEDGSGRDLGGPLEFRSGIDVSYRFDNGSRLGLLFYHLSNADIYDENPGSNSLVLVFNF